MKKLETTLAWVSAAILFQTLYFKFTGAEESRWIFSQLGAEPAGRFGSGVIELIAGILLIIPAMRVYGALLAAGTMAGAIMSHLFILGINVQGDGGFLFGLALIVFGSSLFILYRNRGSIPVLNKWITSHS